MAIAAVDQGQKAGLCVLSADNKEQRPAGCTSGFSLNYKPGTNNRGRGGGGGGGEQRVYEVESPVHSHLCTSSLVATLKRL